MTIWDHVVADMRQRNEIGLKKYGRELATHDGRDTLQDAYEEVLDLAVYLKKELIERHDKDKLIQSQADRICAQSQALSKVAEKPLAVTYQTKPQLYQE